MAVIILHPLIMRKASLKISVMVKLMFESSGHGIRRSSRAAAVVDAVATADPQLVYALTLLRWSGFHLVIDF